MPQQPHRIALDKPRTIEFGHLALRDLDRELVEKRGEKFLEYTAKLMQKAPAFDKSADEMTDEEQKELGIWSMTYIDFDVLITAYRYALKKHEGEFSDEEVAELLDEADEPHELLNHLLRAHPMTQVQEKGPGGVVEDAEGRETAEEADTVPLERRASANT